MWVSSCFSQKEKNGKGFIIIIIIYFQVIISLKVHCFLTAASSAVESKRKAAEAGDQSAKRRKEPGDDWAVIPCETSK